MPKPSESGKGWEYTMLERVFGSVLVAGIVGGVSILSAFTYQASANANAIESLELEANALQSSLLEVSSTLSEVREVLGRIDERLKFLDQRLDSIERN